MATMMRVPIAAFADERILRAMMHEESAIDRLNKRMIEEMGHLLTPSK